MSSGPGFQQSQKAYAQSVGTSNTGRNLIFTRNPTSNDVTYQIGTFWQNTSNQTLWYLNSQTSTSATLQSTWVSIGVAFNQIAVQTGITPVTPTLGGVITFNGAVVAAGTNPVRTDGTGANTMALEVQISQAIAATDATKIGLSNFNSAHFSVDANGFVGLIGGGAAIDSIGVDAATPPGTNPVIPSGTGLVTITGGQVAPGTTTNVIRTDSLAANTLTIEIQRSQAVAVSTVGDNGVSHYNSAHFTVNSDGFVGLAGGGQAIDSIGTQTGTNPIVPTVAGLVTINGAVVAAGTNPVRTDGTGANTMAVEVQISQAIAATDATKIGLSNFNSAHFSVDGNGFVSLAGGGEAVDSFQVDAATGPGTNPVLPTAAGLVTVTGGQVAAGTTTNVIRTDSLAANTYTVEIQRSQAVATSTIGDNGVSHFNSANFTVDANGFVSSSTTLNASISTPADATYYIAGSLANNSISGTFCIGWTGTNRNQSMTIQCDGRLANGVGTVSVISNDCLSGQVVLSNPRLVSQNSDTAAILAIDVANRNGESGPLTIYWFGNPNYQPALVPSVGAVSAVTNYGIRIDTVGAISFDGAYTFPTADGTAGQVLTTNGAGQLSFSGSGAGTWTVIGASQTLAVNKGYICTTGAGLSLALPATSAVGDTIEVSLDGSTSWTITQPNAGTQIRIGSAQTTLGVGGSLASTAVGDSIKLVCETVNARWIVVSMVGNITVV